MADSLLGKQLEEYQLEKLLGQGGMARVYRALDTRLKRYAAIKVIDAQFREDSEYSRRFELEAQALGQLNHPNVVQLYRYGRVDDVLYMAMAYVEGSDVKAALDDYRAVGDYMALEEALRILRETAAALDYVHSRKIIHRDIKPSNIMLDKDGRALLTDFGLALMTQVGTMGEIFGTPQYLAPEQAISSAAVVPQSDLYSLGIIAYEMFTGQIPFDGDEPMTVAIMHMNDVPPAPRSLRPELSEAVEAVLLKQLEKEPENRYQTGAEFVQALEAAVKGDSELRRRTTMPRMSIPQLVALELEKNPLPPIPAAMTPPQKKSAEMPSITERAAKDSVSDTTLPHTAPATQVKPRQATELAPKASDSSPRIAAAPRMTTEQAKVKAKPNPIMAYLPYAIGGTIFALVAIVVILFFVNGNNANPDALATAELTLNPTIDDPDFPATEAAEAAATGTALAEAAIASQTSNAFNSSIQQTQDSLNGTATALALQATQLAETQNAPTLDNSIVFQSQTEAAANIATQNAIVIVPSATNAPQMAELSLTWRRDDWLLIENRSDAALDLRFLRLSNTGDNARTLTGESFGENVLLQRGQCVAFAKRNQADRLEPDCDLLAIVVIEEGRDRIWENHFSVSYENGLNPNPIVTCNRRDEECEFGVVLR